ncbi:MAG: sulfurtransferase TusA family protein [Gammaproteobacteria bacterium]|nr:sulfurtransferase TusA family protein [Gammaproteobacteria bacterium]
MEFDETLDCKGLSCPMPIIKLAKAMKKMPSGKVLQMIGTDPGSKEDVPRWCTKTGNKLLGSADEGGANVFYIQKA